MIILCISNSLSWLTRSMLEVLLRIRMLMRMIKTKSTMHSLKRLIRWHQLQATSQISQHPMTDPAKQSLALATTRCLNVNRSWLSSCLNWTDWWLLIAMTGIYFGLIPKAKTTSTRGLTLIRRSITSLWRSNWQEKTEWQSTLNGCKISILTFISTPFPRHSSSRNNGIYLLIPLSEKSKFFETSI